MNETWEIKCLLADIRAAAQDVRATGAQVRAEQEALARKNAQSDKDRARAARRGDLGPDWQAVQERIDAGRTTLTDVISGKDASPEAGHLMDTAADRLVEIPDEFKQHVKDKKGAPLAELEETAEAIRATVARLRQQSNGSGMG